MGENAVQPDHTPEPGTLLSLAMITPPQGVPSLAAALRNPEALTVALEAAADSAADAPHEADDHENEAKKTA
jgi:hypothetical protein